MSVLYFANIGNRDVKHAEINQVIPRLSGKEWLDKYDSVKDKLDFPILRTGLEYALKNLTKRSIDRLILFYTDQPETIPERFRQSDTLWFAELVKCLIAERFKTRIKAIKLIPISGAPNDYDDMHRFYSDSLNALKNTAAVKLAFIAPAGGIPACNMNLVLQGSRVFGPRSQVILISETPGSAPKFLNISAEIIRSHNRKALENLAEHYNFGGLAKILRQDNRQLAYALSLLAESLQYRLYFDFEAALLCLNQINKNTLPADAEELIRHIHDTLQSMRQTVQPFSGGVPADQRAAWVNFQKMLLMEISVNARVIWNARQYVDFLGRMFRLQEGILRIFFEEQTGYSADIDNYPEDFKTWRACYGKELVQYFEANPHNGKFKASPTRKVLLEYLGFIANNKRDYQAILDYCNKIDHLAALRNQSILAHGNKPISKNRITGIFGKRLTQNIAKLARIWSLPDNFEQYHQAIRTITDNY